MTILELVDRLLMLDVPEDTEVEVMTSFNDSAWFARCDTVEIVDGKVQLSSNE